LGGFSQENLSITDACVDPVRDGIRCQRRWIRSDPCRAEGPEVQDNELTTEKTETAEHATQLTSRLALAKNSKKKSGVSPSIVSLSSLD